MKLSVEQIKQIDYVLAKHYSFENFDDVRIELVDHIVTDIEFEMKNNQILFEDALNSVLFKWKTEISWDRNSKHNTVPKMISKLWNKLDWKYNSITIALVVLLFAITQFYRKEVWVTYAMYFIGIIGILLGSYLLRIFKKNRFNTVLSMYVEDRLIVQIIMVAIGVIGNGVLNYYDGDLLSNPGFVAIVYATITLGIKTTLMRKNIKIENQLLKVL